MDSAWIDKLRESIYTNSISQSNIEQDLPLETFEFVYNMALKIHNEFHTIINQHGERCVERLIPMITSSLEALNRIYSDKNELEIKCDLLTKDNEHWKMQCDKEKQSRKRADEARLFAEDRLFGKMNEFDAAVLGFQNNKNMDEIRLRNLRDQVVRLEGRLSEKQAEIDKLFAKNSVLWKHRLTNMNRPSITFQQNQRIPFPSLPNNITDGNSSEPVENINGVENPEYSIEVEMKESRNESSLANELAINEQIKDIIKENEELKAKQQTLDSLNEELNKWKYELEISKTENKSTSTLVETYKKRISDLEADLKTMKHDLVLYINKCELLEDEESIPLAQRKRFTRAEMNKVLYERNTYKEQLIMLEDYTKSIQRYRVQQQKKLPFWKRSQDNNKTQPANLNVSLPASIWKPKVSTNLQQSHLVMQENREKLHGWILTPNFMEDIKKDLPRLIHCGPIFGKFSKSKISNTAEIISAVSVNLYPDLLHSRGNSFAFCDTVSSYSSNNNSPSFNQSTAEGIISQSFTCDDKSPGCFVWIAATSDTESYLSVINLNRPSEITDFFTIRESSIQCLECVPGYTESEIANDSVELSTEHTISSSFNTKSQVERSTPKYTVKSMQSNFGKMNRIITFDQMELSSVESDNSPDFNSDVNTTESTPLDHRLRPTVWVGCKSGDLYIYPSSSDRSNCIYHLLLPDAITGIIYQNSRVFVAMADGSLAVFNRFNASNCSDGHLFGLWNMGTYYGITPDDNRYSIRCLEGISTEHKIWMGYRNYIIVIDDKSLTETFSFKAHLRIEFVIRKMCWSKLGVWVAFTLAPFLRLFSATEYNILQDINLEPQLNLMIEPFLLGLSYVRITSLSVVADCLWIGLNNGMVLHNPVMKNAYYDQMKSSAISSNSSNEKFVGILAEDFQLSYHGYSDSVKFFISSTGKYRPFEAWSSESSSPNKQKSFVISGGEGYRDFRFSENTLNSDHSTSERKGGVASGDISNANSHLIIWQHRKEL